MIHDINRKFPYFLVKQVILHMILHVLITYSITTQYIFFRHLQLLGQNCKTKSQRTINSRAEGAEIFLDFFSIFRAEFTEMFFIKFCLKKWIK